MKGDKGLSQSKKIMHAKFAHLCSIKLVYTGSSASILASFPFILLPKLESIDEIEPVR